MKGFVTPVTMVISFLTKFSLVSAPILLEIATSSTNHHCPSADLLSFAFPSNSMLANGHESNGLTDWPISLKALCFAASGVCTDGKIFTRLIPAAALALDLLPPGNLGEAGRLKFQDKVVRLDEGTAHAFIIIF